jgi:hypothetical protein
MQFWLGESLGADHGMDVAEASPVSRRDRLGEVEGVVRCVTSLYGLLGSERSPKPPLSAVRGQGWGCPLMFLFDWISVRDTDAVHVQKSSIGRRVMRKAMARRRGHPRVSSYTRLAHQEPNDKVAGHDDGLLQEEGRRQCR